MRTVADRTALVAGLAIVALAIASATAAERMSRKEGQRLPFVLTAAIRTALAPDLDGRLDEPCWQRAGEARDFVLYGGRGYASQKTEVLTLFDDANLYLGVRCFTSAPNALKATAAATDDAVCADDCVEVFLVPQASATLEEQPEGSRYFHLAANSRGIRFDEVGMAGPESWSAPWHCQAAVLADRWELEIAVPFAALRTSVTSGQAWAANVNRAATAKGEFSGWSIPFAGFHDPLHFGRLVFLDDWPQPGSK